MWKCRLQSPGAPCWPHALFGTTTPPQLGSGRAVLPDALIIFAAVRSLWNHRRECIAIFASWMRIIVPLVAVGFAAYAWFWRDYAIGGAPGRCSPPRPRFAVYLGR